MKEFVRNTLILTSAAALWACNAPPVKPMINPDGSALTEEQAKAFADPDIADPTLVAPTQAPLEAAPTPQPLAGDPNYISPYQNTPLSELNDRSGIVSLTDVQDPRGLNRRCIAAVTWHTATNSAPYIFAEFAADGDYGDVDTVTLYRYGVELGTYDAEQGQVPPETNNSGLVGCVNNIPAVNPY